MTAWVQLNEDRRLVNGIRARRETVGMTLTALADEVGVNKGELSQIETGRRMPERAELLAIAEALRTKADTLFPVLHVPDGEEPVLNVGRPRQAEEPPQLPARRGSGPARQVELLIQLLRDQGSDGVTPLEALEHIGSFRLGARIYDLRRRGFNIETRSARTAGGATVARYVLHEETT